MYLSLCGFDSVYIDCSFRVALRCCCAGMDSMLLAASLLHNFSFFIITLCLTCYQGRGTFNLLCTLASLFGFIGSEIQSNQSHILSSKFQTNSRQNKKSLQNEHFFKWQIMHTQDEEKQHGSLNRAKSQQVLAYMILKKSHILRSDLIRSCCLESYSTTWGASNTVLARICILNSCSSSVQDRWYPNAYCTRWSPDLEVASIELLFLIG